MLSFLIALGLMVVLSPIAFQYLQKSMDLDTAGAAAYHATQISEARDRYIKDNYATILANSAGGPVSITTIMLKNAGYLDAAINDLNINNQTYQTRAIKVTAGGNDLLRVLTVTSGGQAFSETEIRNIAAKTAKIGGGFVSSLDTAVAQGYRGSYQVPLADYGLSPGAGHVAIGGFFNSQGVLGDYLYRNAIPGHPELNQMNTALSMGGNPINSVSTLTATGNIATTDNVQGGDLLATRDMTAGRNIAAAGDVSGTNITAIGTVSGRDLLASRKINVGGNIAVNGTITAGDSISSNGTVSGAYLRPTTDATEGAYCASNGLIAKTSSGIILSCQSGVWKKMHGQGGFCPNPKMYLVLNRAGTYSIRNNDDCAWQFFAYQNSNKANYIEIYIDGVNVGIAGMSRGYSVNGFVGGAILPGTTFAARLYQDIWPGQVYIQRP